VLKDFIKNKEDSNINIIVITEKNNDSPDKLFPSARKVQEECKKRGIPFYPILVPGSIYVSDYDQDNPNIVIRHIKEHSKKIELNPKNTVVIVRGSVVNDIKISPLFTYLEAKGAFIINSKNTIDLCANKYNTTVKLKMDGVPVPRTSLISDIKSLDSVLNSIGNEFPIVVKTLRGSAGVGVSRIDSKESLKGVLQTLWKHRAQLLVQEYIDTDYDVRSVVMDGKVIASMKRKRIKEDFRSNYSLGGDVEKYTLSPKEEAIVLNAAKSSGAFFCGVDHMMKDGEPYVLEVNSSPGSKGVQKATGINTISVLFDYITDKNNWKKEVKEIGYKEKIIFPEISNLKLDAKADTGNGMYNVLHADNIKIIGNIVSFSTFGNKIVKKLEKVVEVAKGGLQDYETDRPLVKFDVLFNEKTYKGVLFTLDERPEPRTPVLLCRKFLIDVGVNVNPKIEFALGESINFTQFRQMFIK
jgi:RimK family alpha-L-glutamate ligase